MAICADCKQEMLDEETKSCKEFPHIFLAEVMFERDTEYFDYNARCHDCDIENKPGNVHHYGCDIERCPLCAGQLLSCGCGAQNRMLCKEV